MYSYYTVKKIWLEYKEKIIFKDIFIFFTLLLIFLLYVKSTKALPKKKNKLFFCMNPLPRWENY